MDVLKQPKNRALVRFYKRRQNVSLNGGDTVVHKTPLI